MPLCGLRRSLWSRGGDRFEVTWGIIICFLFDFYPYSMGKRKMFFDERSGIAERHELRRKNALIIIICCKMIIFGPKFRE